MFLEAIRSALCQRAFRLVGVILVGLTIEVGFGALIPGLGSIIALSILAGSSHPPSIKKAIVIIALLSSITLLVLAITLITHDKTALYALTIALLYVWSFYLAVGKKTVAIGRMSLTMTVVVSTLVAASPALAIVIVQEMMVSITLGVGLVIGVFVLFPATVEPKDVIVEPEQASDNASVSQLYHALIATIIMVPLHLYLTFDGLAATVILLTSAMVLAQSNWHQSKMYAFLFALGNVLGGLLALIAVFITDVQSSWLVFLFVTLAIALLMASSSESRSRIAPAFAPACTAFLLLFGMTLSPLATSGDVDVMQRLFQILSAILYAMGVFGVADMLFMKWREKSPVSSAALR